MTTDYLGHPTWVEWSAEWYPCCDHCRDDDEYHTGHIAPCPLDCNHED